MGNHSKHVKPTGDSPIGKPMIPQQGIPVQPLPNMVKLGQTFDNAFVVLTIETPQGSSTYFFQPDQAKNIGEALISMGQAGNAGLTLPGVN